MTTYTEKGAKPDIGKYHGFDHVTFWVGNAKQAATYYMTRCMVFWAVSPPNLTLPESDGFKSIGYKGLETGSREIACHAVSQGTIRFVFVSPLNPGNKIYGDHMTWDTREFDLTPANYQFSCSQAAWWRCQRYSYPLVADRLTIVFQMSLLLSMTVEASIMLLLSVVLVQFVSLGRSRLV